MIRVSHPQSDLRMRQYDLNHTHALIEHAQDKPWVLIRTGSHKQCDSTFTQLKSKRDYMAVVQMSDIKGD